MQTLNGDKLISELEAEIKANEKKRDEAVKSGWFEKAAKLEVTNQGINRALQIINLGDFHLETN
jgi:hypothetical protein